MDTEQFYLGRQPILDRQQQIIGFEMLFRSAQSLNAALISDVRAASASVMVNALADFGFREVLGRHKGYFNVSYDMLMSDVIELLPQEQVVIELLETIEISDALIERCRYLKALGFSLALDDHVVSPAFEALYDVVDVVKLDILQNSTTEIAAMLKQLRQWPLTLLAEKVENLEQYEVCADLGFDLFQGYYFARPVVLKQKKVDITKLAMMQLMEKVLLNAEIHEIEETFKQNPSLTFNLLRLVNSVSIGVREPIKTLRHAIMVLGTDQLKRWVTLSLYASNDTMGTHSPLLEIAATRGKLMERLVVAQKKNGLHDYPDQAFMTGVLSLIDVLFDTPMLEIVNNLSLADEIRHALLDRTGELGMILSMVEMLELSEFKPVSEFLDRSGLSLQQLKIAQLETFQWTTCLGASL